MPLPDAVEVVALGAPALGVDPSTTAGLIGEISSTLLSDVHQLEHGRPAAELIDLDPLELEGELRGHPWIVASKGRVGFSAEDLARYAPEAGVPVPLLAVAVEGADWRGEDVGDVVPVHPWQWTNRIQPLYAGDIARGRIRVRGRVRGPLAAAAVDPDAGRRRPAGAPPRQGRAVDPEHERLPRAAARPDAGRAGA